MKHVNYDIPEAIIEDLKFEYGATDEQLARCNMQMIQFFPPLDKYEPVEMSFSYYLRAYEYFTKEYDIDEHEEAYDEYITLLLAGYPIETAFERIEPDIWFEENPLDYYYEFNNDPDMYFMYN